MEDRTRYNKVNIETMFNNSLDNIRHLYRLNQINYVSLVSFYDCIECLSKLNVIDKKHEESYLKSAVNIFNKYGIKLTKVESSKLKYLCLLRNYLLHRIYDREEYILDFKNQQENIITLFSKLEDKIKEPKINKKHERNLENISDEDISKPPRQSPLTEQKPNKIISESINDDTPKNHKKKRNRYYSNKKKNKELVMK